MRDGNEQDAYLFFLRHALLVLEKLTRHPEASQAANRAVLTKAGQIVNANLTNMEKIKPAIIRRHKQYTDAMARRKAEREEWERNNHGSMGWPMEGTGKGTDIPSHDTRKTLEGGQHKDLAARLARRSMKHPPTRQHRPSSPHGDADSESRELQKEIDALAHQITDSARLGNDIYTTRRGTVDSGTKTFTPSAYRYPTVPQKTAYEAWGDTAKPLAPSSTKPPPTKGVLRPPGSEYGSLPPPRPAKERDHSIEPPARPQKQSEYADAPPPRPAKELAQTAVMAPPSPPSRAATPALDPSKYTFKASAQLENGSPLRTIFLPANLRSTFLRIAGPNTNRNLETCGILCGTLISNAFFISNLVIPAQDSTSDTCEMTHEEDLWSFCDSNNLLILGWIHTHPTQTCFLSSRDLHTHAGFQIQLAESIAIVLAPRQDPSWGIFRLTVPPGKQVIVSCKQSGIFHPHENVEGGLYTDAGRPGHVVEIEGVDFTVVDLREESANK